MLRRKALASLGLVGPVLIAPASHPRLHRLQEYLLRSQYPTRASTPRRIRTPRHWSSVTPAGPEDLPLVLCPTERC
jgi:hypothetical protein